MSRNASVYIVEDHGGSATALLRITDHNLIESIVRTAVQDETKKMHERMSRLRQSFPGAFERTPRRRPTGQPGGHHFPEAA